jgi:hypothetical protein
MSLFFHNFIFATVEDQLRILPGNLPLNSFARSEVIEVLAMIIQMVGNVSESHDFDYAKSLSR